MKSISGEPTGKVRIPELRCVCGNEKVYYCTVDVDGLIVNQLFCPGCGIIMRTPESDIGGKWLIEHWKKTVMRHIPDKPKMTINEFLQKYRRVEHGMNVTRPRVLCADGFTVSVQAGYGIHSIPGCDADSYIDVELGFPAEKEDDWIIYAKNRSMPTDTVYSFVPVELVDKVLDTHGGITGADFSNDKAGKWAGGDTNANPDD